jgi:hypothetical protein
MKLLLIDTNIFVCFFEQGLSFDTSSTFKQPEELSILEKLLKKLEQDKIKLLLPEIIIIETKRMKKVKIKELDDLYKTAFLKIQETNSQKKYLSSTAQEKIKKSLDEICKEEKESIEKAWNVFEQISKHKNTDIIKINEAILIESCKRAFSGKKPYDKNLPKTIQADCLVIESVKLYLSLNKIENYDMYLCTFDDDFYEDEKKTKLSEDITSELKIKDFSIGLQEMMKKLKFIRKIKKPKREIKKQNVYPVIPQEIIKFDKTDVQNISTD